MGQAKDASAAKVGGHKAAAIDWSVVAFVLSLCAAAFAYGIATMKWQIFPYQLIDHAGAALTSLHAIEDEDVMHSLSRIDKQAKPELIGKTLAAGAGNELLLVTGGPNQDAKHCPKFGCLAWIVNRKGEILHSWPFDAEGLFKDIGSDWSGHTEPHNFYPVGLQMMPDGSLIATFHGRNIYPYAAGIARIAWNGKILWKRMDNAHHWFVTAPDGRTYAPIQLREKMAHFADTNIKIRCPTVTYNEGIRVYRADGSVEKTLLLIASLVKSGFSGLLYSLRDDCDPLHINSVDIVTPEIAGKLPGIDAGDLLVSFREPSAIAIIDANDGHVKKLVSGRTAAQHSAHFLPDGTVLAFDNQGGGLETGGSRIAHINMLTGDTETLFPRPGNRTALPFYSDDGGHIMVSPDGRRIMVSSKEESRDLEIDVATGKPLWSMDHIFDVGPFIDGKGATPRAAWFKSYGTYYLTAEQIRTLPLH